MYSTILDTPNQGWYIVLMVVLNKDGREIEVLKVTGSAEEPCIDGCQFVVGDDEPTEADVEYIYHTYFAELSDEAYQNQVMAAEYACEGDR